MGGLNQNNTHYSAPAMQQASHHSGANMSHGGYNPRNATKKDGVSYAALPEYQYPASKSNTGSGFPNHPNRGVTPAAKMALPRQHHYPVQQQQQQPLIESPTLSQGSENQDSSTASNGSQQFHYNPYDTSSSRVTYQHQQQQYAAAQQQQQYGQFPNTDNASRTTSLGYDSTTAQSGGYGYEEEQMEEAPAKSILPYGTLHGNLEGYVSFVPYPTEEFSNPNKTMQVPSEGNMSRVFLGQLPYQVTDMQLDWLCFTFGNGGAVHFPERITKHDPMRGCKVPTGCIHAYADNEAVTSMLSHMHKRILVDDTGVWYAETQEQQSILNDYCLMMKNDRTKRYQNRPYDTVVAQFATSNFVQRRR